MDFGQTFAVSFLADEVFKVLIRIGKQLAFFYKAVTVQQTVMHLVFLNQTSDILTKGGRKHA